MPPSPATPRFFSGNRLNAPAAPMRAGHLAVHDRPDRLGAVLDDVQPVPRRHRADRAHVDRVAVEVDRNHRARARGHRVRQAGRIHQVLGVDVHEDRRRAGRHDGARGRHEAVGRGDHLVAGARRRGPAGRGTARRCPEFRPSACAAPHTRANRRSNSATWGPRTNWQRLNSLHHPRDDRPVLELARQIHVLHAHGRLHLDLFAQAHVLGLFAQAHVLGLFAQALIGRGRTRRWNRSCTSPGRRGGAGGPGA